LIQQLNQKAEAWREIELVRARKMLDRGEDVEKVLQAMSASLTRKMLNGPLRDLNHPTALQRDKARDAVQQFFFEPSTSADAPASGVRTS
jgi:glutamyl-tRNA reductase